LLLAAFAEVPSPEATGESAVDITFELAPRAEEISAAVAPEPGPPSTLLLGEPLPGNSPAKVEAPSATLVPEAMEAPPRPPEVSAILSLPEERPLEQEAGAALAPVPPEPSLEKLVPPVEAPTAVDAHEFARGKPPPAHASAANPPPANQPAQPQTQTATVQASAGRRAQQEVRPGDTTRAPDRAPAAALKSDETERRLEEDYFRQIVRKISQYRFYSRVQHDAEHGMVVTRLTIARDGRVLDVSLLKSSGFPNLDNAVVETIRQASPFAPLPSELAQDHKTFIVPVNYTREH
jgi:TonB family protein